MSSTVSVVVVTWNAAQLLPECLGALHAQQLSPAPEIIVVDNGSDDDTVQVLERDWPGVRVVALPRNLGFTGGANAGMAAATGDIIALINNDATADPLFLSEARSALEADPRRGAVTGLIVLADTYAPVGGRPQGALVGFDGTAWAADADGRVLVNSTGGEVTRSANGRDRDWLTPLPDLERQSGPVAAFSGGAVALRRQALDEVGAFDERLFMYYEDSDLSWRLRAAGWLVWFERAAQVRHRHAASSGTSTDFFLFHNERNRLLFALRHGTGGVLLRAAGRSVLAAARSLTTGDLRSVRRKCRAIASAARLAPAYRRERRAAESTSQSPRAALWRGAPAD